MPTYEYECRVCAHTFESFQKITADPIKRCPKCGKSVRRLFGGGMGIIFKGSGFYTTDYKHSHGSSGNGSPGKDTKTEGEKTGKGSSAAGQSASEHSTSTEKSSTTSADSPSKKSDRDR